LTPTSIRQRIVKWQREERAERRFKPSLRQQAYGLSRLYDTWDQKTPCPSLIHASVFRRPVRDSSLSACSPSKLIDQCTKTTKLKSDKPNNVYRAVTKGLRVVKPLSALFLFGGKNMEELIDPEKAAKILGIKTITIYK
jgi:hypothetical protein